MNENNFKVNFCSKRHSQIPKSSTLEYIIIIKTKRKQSKLKYNQQFPTSTPDLTH